MSTPKCIACNSAPAMTLDSQGPYFCTKRCAGAWGLLHYNADGAEKWCSYCDEWHSFDHWWEAVDGVILTGADRWKMCKVEADD